MGWETPSQSNPRRIKTELERYFVANCLTLLTLVAHLAGQASALDARALLHVLEMRRGYCIFANFVESSSSVHHKPW